MSTHPVRGSEPARSSKTFLAFVRTALGVMADIQVRGAENVPPRGACLVVFNQLSLFDTPLLRVAIPRSDVAGLVAVEYRRNAFFRYMVERGGGIWIDRGMGDRRALETALRMLQRGWVIGISPEGRRSRSGALERGRPGAAALAMRAAVPVVPMAIANMDAVAGSLARLRRAEVTVRFGPPFRIAPPSRHGRKGQRQQAIDDMMFRLADLLPERYRGVYAARGSFSNEWVAP